MDLMLDDPGLVENSDDIHCYHACMIMLMRTLSNAPVLSFSQLDKLLGTRRGTYTWPFGLIRICLSMPFDVMFISDIDISALLGRGGDYLREYFGEYVGKIQSEHLNLAQVQIDCNSITHSLDSVYYRRSANSDDLRSLMREGWYCLCNVNQRVLQADEGYVGHMVFVYGFSRRGVRLHNPGPPSLRSTEISWEMFDKAWAYPASHVRNVLAVRPSA